MSASINPDIITDGLVLCLDAGNPASYPGSGTLWTDLSGNGNNGTLTNGPTFDSTNKGSIVFDGTNDYVATSLALPSPVTTPTTFDIIFRNNSATAGSKGLIGASAYASSGFSVGLINGQANMRHTYNASGSAFEGNFVYNTSTITHGTFIFNGRNIIGYRNTTSVLSTTAGFDAVANSNGISIAYNQQGGWTFSQVNIYVVRIYNRVLSVSEIIQNYNATKGRYGL